MNISLSDIKEKPLLNTVLSALIGLIAGGGIMGSTAFRYDAFTGKEGRELKEDIEKLDRKIEELKKGIPPYWFKERVDDHIKDKSIHK